MNHSVEEIKAVAEAALLTSQAVDQARHALEADPGSEDLKVALSDAETLAATAKATADALSREDPDPVEKKKAKLLKKQGIIKSQLKNLGVDTDEDDDDEDDSDEDDDTRPLTVGEYNRIQANNLRKTTVQMVDAIPDAADREAVRDALKSIVASNDPAADFKKAVGIANMDRNSKVLQEVARKAFPKTAPTRTGAAPRVEEVFTPTALEQSYMQAPFNLAKEDILKSRATEAKE